MELSRAGVESARRARQRWLPSLAVLVLLVVFAALRLELLRGDNVKKGWDSDDAVFGLMAKRIFEGQRLDIFYWGQNYMGPFTPLVTAAVAGVRGALGIEPAVGPWALRVATFLQLAAGIVLHLFAFWRLFGGLPAFAACLLLAVGPPYLLAGGVRSGTEMSFFFSSILLTLAARDLTGSPVPRFAFGLAAGLGWWMNQGVVFVLAPYLVVAAVRRFSALPEARRPLEREVLRFVAGFAIGYAPVLLGRAFGWFPVTYTFQTRLWPDGGFWARLGTFLAKDVWLFLGLDDGPIGLLARASSVLALVFLASELVRRRHVPPTDWIEKALFVFLILASSIWFFVTAKRDPGHERYLAPAIGVAYLLIARGLVGLWRSRSSGWLAALPFALLLAALYQNGLERTRQLAQEVSPEVLLARIRRAGYQVCYADYWTAYKYQFLSGETIRFITYHGRDRSPEESKRWKALPKPHGLVERSLAVREFTPEDEANQGGPRRRRGLP